MLDQPGKKSIYFKKNRLELKSTKYEICEQFRDLSGIKPCKYKGRVNLILF